MPTASAAFCFPEQPLAGNPARNTSARTSLGNQSCARIEQCPRNQIATSTTWLPAFLPTAEDRQPPVATRQLDGNLRPDTQPADQRNCHFRRGVDPANLSRQPFSGVSVTSSNLPASHGPPPYMPAEAIIPSISFSRHPHLIQQTSEVIASPDYPMDTFAPSQRTALFAGIHDRAQVLDPRFLPPPALESRQVLHSNSRQMLRFGSVLPRTATPSIIGNGLGHASAIIPAPFATSGLSQNSSIARRPSTCSIATADSRTRPLRSALLQTLTPVHSTAQRGGTALTNPLARRTAAALDGRDATHLATPENPRARTDPVPRAFIVPSDQPPPELRFRISSTPGNDTHPSARRSLDSFGRAPSVGTSSATHMQNSGTSYGSHGLLDWNQILQVLKPRILRLLWELSRQNIPQSLAGTSGPVGLMWEEIVVGMERHFRKDMAALQSLLSGKSWKTAVQSILNTAREVVRYQVQENGSGCLRYRLDPETDAALQSTEVRSETRRMTTSAPQAPSRSEDPFVRAESDDVHGVLVDYGTYGDGRLEKEQGLEPVVDSVAVCVPAHRNALRSSATTPRPTGGRGEAISPQELEAAFDRGDVTVGPPATSVSSVSDKVTNIMARQHATHRQHMPMLNPARDGCLSQHVGGGPNAVEDSATKLIVDSREVSAVDCSVPETAVDAEKASKTDECGLPAETEVVELEEHQHSPKELENTRRLAKTRRVEEYASPEAGHMEPRGLHLATSVDSGDYPEGTEPCGSVDDVAENEAAQGSQNAMVSLPESASEEPVARTPRPSSASKTRVNVRMEFEEVVKELNWVLSRGKAEEDAAVARVASLREAIKCYEQRRHHLSDWLQARRKKVATAAHKTAAAVDAWAANPASPGALAVLWKWINVFCNLADVEVDVPEVEHGNSQENSMNRVTNSEPVIQAPTVGESCQTASDFGQPVAGRSEETRQSEGRQPSTLASAKRLRRRGAVPADSGGSPSRSRKRRAVRR